jgi:hypothetical protein
MLQNAKPMELCIVPEIAGEQPSQWETKWTLHCFNFLSSRVKKSEMDRLFLSIYTKTTQDSQERRALHCLYSIHGLLFLQTFLRHSFCALPNTYTVI